MSRPPNRLGILAALLLVLWLVAMAAHFPERSVELFPLTALVAGLVEVARDKQRRAARCAGDSSQMN